MKWHYYLLLISLTFCNQLEEQQSGSIEDLDSPIGSNASLPHLIKGEDQNIYLSWIEEGDSNLASFYFSRLDGDEWSNPEKIAEGTNWFINWADYPMLAVDKDGNKMAHYLAKSTSGNYSYDVKIITQKADSLDWSMPLPPHTDNTPTEHGFVTILPNNNETFTVAWLDGRNTGEKSNDNHHSTAGAMTLRTAVVDMEGNLSEEYELDNRVCDCCQTSGVMTKNGPLFVYRDRSVDEIRDMAFVTKLNDLWSEPKLVAQDNWNIAGCPVNGPRSAKFQETVSVAWYSEALGRPKVKVAFMNGETFSNPIIVDDTSPIGRVDVVMIDEETAIVSWIDGGERPAIKYRKVSSSGSMSSVFSIAEISEGRGSGFPQMEMHNNSLYFAWTEMSELNKIRMKKVAVD